ncbi:hypothetical protein D0Z70_13880 [Sphingobium terrigena]|uniref:Uncharacterized protein n=1 Tax=Sphingobium terrigena TaxID=2304063 RepID=A0A418YRH2_9SPHN|nr:hypothetical protein [Sphingobium terrigena]RJG54216.1 hypothetical protein D0Z70_13880 [Sphingobium terrigena]
MLLSYEDFRSFFEARGIAEADGRAQLEIFEQMLDPFVINGLEGKDLGADVDLDSDTDLIALEWGHIAQLDFNAAATDEMAGKKET